MNLDFSPWPFFLVLGRTAALIGFFPMFAEAQLPRSMKAGVALWISLVMMPIIPVSNYQPQGLPDLALAVGVEVILGFTFALAVRLIFSGILLGAQWIDGEVGFQAAQQVNPLSGTPNSPFGTLTLIISSLLFWSMGYFENLIKAWARIFQLLPAPVTRLPSITGETLLNLSAQIFLRALEFATPMLAVMFLVTFTIGMLARAIQGVNIFFETYNIKLLIGLTTLVTLAPLLLHLMQKHLEQIPDSWMLILQALRSQ